MGEKYNFQNTSFSFVLKKNLNRVRTPLREVATQFEKNNFYSSFSSHGGDGLTCVSFQSVDAAFAKARDIHGLPRPSKKDDPEQRSELGAVLLEATKILAHE